MRRLRVLGLALATLGGFAAGACNFVLGLAENPPGAGGGAGTGAGTSTSSGSGNGTSSTSGGGGDGGMEPDADAGVDAGPVGRGMWSTSFTGPTVAAIAAGPNGSVYLTGGGAQGPASFGCGADAGTSGIGSATGTGYLVQLDGMGNCLWGFFFSDRAAGTAVAVDSQGDVALTAEFSGSNVNVIGTWPPEPTGLGQINSFIALFDSSHALSWARLLGDSMNPPGNQMATGVAIDESQNVVVSASYTSTIAVLAALGAVPPVKVETMADGIDSVVLRFDMNVNIGAPLWITGAMGTPQLASAVALDSSGDVALAGTTTGPTMLGKTSLPAPMTTASIFLASWGSDGGVPFAAVPGGDQDLQDGGSSPQDRRSTAFDGAGNMLLGATFTGTIGADAGAPAAGQSVYLARYAGTGPALLSSIRFGSDTAGEDATLAGIAPYVGGNGSVTFAGGFQGTPSFPGGKSITNPVGASAAYVAKVDSTLGNVIWLEKYGDGTSTQVVDAVAIDPNGGDILVAGHYQGTLDFGGKATPLVNTSGNPQLFVARLAP